jgi:hypothetical protein
MSTQIFTSAQDNCKVDHTKIATLASSFDTDILPSYDDNWAFIGGDYSWMSNPTNEYTTALGGNILNVKSGSASMAIILPVDVDVNDVITLQGVATGNGLGGANCQFLIGVSYVSCQDFTGAVEEKVNVFTLIPAQLFPQIPAVNFTTCFSLEKTNVTLPAGTLLYVGVNCPTFYNPPAKCNFSYTLDITKSCTPIVPLNIRIQNCCETTVFEVISASTQNLPTSGTFSDTEGNCWTIIEETEDPIDTARFVASNYQDCAACLIANPCPLNLVVQSCCSGQSESFTGSLPGINLGDTFVDTYGFCWNVVEETGGPITGLVIVNSITTDCPTCSALPNACPYVYRIDTCCEGVKMYLYTTLDLIGSGVMPGDTFMDQYGYCWQIQPAPVSETVNGAFIQAVTNYGPGACVACVNDGTGCDSYVTYKVQNCCSGALEYVSYQYGLNVDSTIQITTTLDVSVNECYTIIDWDNTTTPTITINVFNGVLNDCKQCIIYNGGCPYFYEVSDCCLVQPNKVVYLSAGFTPGMAIIDTSYNCWTIVDKTVGPATMSALEGGYQDCEECLNNFACP